MRKNLHFLRIFTISFILLFGSGFVMGQAWLYNFGIGTGTFASATASTTFLPTSTSGTARVTVGTNPGSIVLANPGQAVIGTYSELQITSNTGSASTTKFSIYDYTASKGGTTWDDRVDCIFAAATWGAENSFYRKSTIEYGNVNMSVLDGSGEWTLATNAAVNTAASNTPEYLGTHILSTSWTGAATSDWFTSGNWTIGVPNANIDVLILASSTNYPTISSAAACDDITIQSGASLIGAENLTVNGTSTMQRSISDYSAATNGWHLLSSPVNTMVIAASDFAPGTATPNLDDFYAWDEVGYQWLNYKVVANSITNFVNGKGYLVSYETLDTKNFVGAFNKTNLTFSDLSKTIGKGNGWHLLGNPFQSALQWSNTDWARTNIAVGAKIMNTGGSYSDILVAGANEFIPANQGFFVQASSSTNSITLPLSQRVHNSTAFYKSAPTNLLTLRASDGNYFVETWIQAMDGATIGYDEQYDMNFLGGVYNSPYLYSAISETVKLSTNRIAPIEQLTEVPLAFKSFSDKAFTISTTNASSFGDDIEVYLKDTKNNVLINLKEITEYNFVANAGELTDRFVVQFFKSSTGTSDLQSSDLLIYSNENRIYISGSQLGMADIKIFNMLGQKVFSKSMSLGGSQFIDLTKESGWYIVQLSTDLGIKTEKVFLK